MSYPQDNAVRAAIRTEMQTVSTVNTDANIHLRWILGNFENVNTWPGILRSKLSATKTHGYIIYRARTAAEMFGSSIKKRIWTYHIFGMMSHSAGSDTANSEIDWNNEVDAITAALDHKDQAIIGGAKRVEGIQFDLDLRPFDKSLCHTCFGIIKLEPCDQ